MNSNSYFSHDSNARNDSKIVKLRMRHGAAGYGVYFMILERLREEDGYMSAKDYNMVAFDLRVDASLVKSVVEDFGLFAFTEDGECFYSDSFNRRMEVKDETKKARAEAGRKGNEKRWGNKEVIAKSSQNEEISESGMTDGESSGEEAQKSQMRQEVIANYRKCDENASQIIANAMKTHRKESKESKVNIKKTPIGVKEKATPFQTPTLDEIKSYVEEKGYAVDAERFFYFYESKGWMIGKNKMKSWRAAVATWQKEEKSRNENNRQRYYDRRGEVEPAATSAKDYKTTF